MRLAAALLAVVIAAWGSLAPNAEARTPRIGVLFVGRTDTPRSYELFEALRQLGYVEGESVVYELRTAAGDTAQLAQAAGELIATRPDVIVSSTSTAAQALANATQTIPIVMTVVGDPVVLGITTSMSRPTGNVTGFTTSSPTLAAKRVELLRELMPTARKVAHLWVPANPNSRMNETQTQQAAATLGIELLSIPLVSAADIAPAFAKLDHDAPEALLIEAVPLTLTHRHMIIDECRVRDLPAVHTYAFEVRDGALMSYGPTFLENFVGAADYADRILKGAKVADLPFQEPTHFTLALNLRTARSIGLTIPAALLARADEVIE